jgi:hypothetical protein
MDGAARRVANLSHQLSGAVLISLPSVVVKRCELRMPGLKVSCRYIALC